MPPEPEAGPATPPPEAGRDQSVQQAVEQFVNRHAAGERPDPATFAATFPLPLQARILARCREFLAFDGLVGEQPWEPHAAPAETGRTFGEFVIEAELGRGGMGVVYLAYQRSLQRRVALKVMQSGLTLSQRHVERFRREAAAAAQLRHPAIVAVHALAEVDGTFALAMDYVAGRNLADILDDLRLANGADATTVEGSLGLSPDKGYVAECAMFVAQLASALAVAHQHQVVHRDLKPRNLMLDDRRQVRLLDFGLAKSLGEGSLSMSGEITGTAHYMSPEQTLAKRVEVDHRADIWALGVILYEMLTLRRPFDGKNLQQIVYEVCFKEPVPIHKRNHKVPRDLVTICQKALEKDPHNRYATAADLEQDLLRFLRWEPIHARPASAWTRVSKWVRRHRTETALAGALLLTGMTALGIHWQRGRRADAFLLQADQHERHGDYDKAIGAANQALALRSDDRALKTLKALTEARERRVTEATGKALESSRLIDKDRELAILLALAGDDQHSTWETRSAVLDALGSGRIVRTLRPAKVDGVPDRMVGAAWSPDGSTVATVGYDGGVALWERSSGQRLGTLAGHAQGIAITGLSFLGPDRLATASADRTLRLWRLHDRSLQRTIALPGAALLMRTDRSGEHALVVSYEQVTGPFLAQVWRTSDGRPASPPVRHDDAVIAAAISPCGRFAATGSLGADGLRLWRTADGARLGAAGDGPALGHLRALAFRPDSRWLAAAGDRSVWLFDTERGTALGSVQHSLEVTTVAFDPRGQRLLTGARDRTARVWELAERPDGAVTTSEVATLVHGGPLTSVAFDASAQLVVTATGGEDGMLHVFDVGSGRANTGTAVGRYEVGPSVESAEFDADGRAVLGMSSRAGAVLWDFASNRGVVTVRQPGQVPAVAFDATGERFVTAGDDQRLRAFAAADGRQLWSSNKLGNPLRALAVDGAGHRIAASTVVDGTVHLHRLDDGAPLFVLPAHQGTVPVVRFLPGDRLLTAGQRADGRGLAIVWQLAAEPAQRRPLLTVTPERALVAADVSPDGTLLATVAEAAERVQLWSTTDGSARGELGGHRARIQWLRWGPDGTLLTASQDGSALLQRADGTELARLATDQSLSFATFSRDGALVLTCADGADEARLWRTADASELVRFHGHHRSCSGGDFSPDGQWLVSAARDGTTCVWPTDPIAAARRLPLRTLSDAERRRYRIPPPADPQPK